MTDSLADRLDEIAKVVDYPRLVSVIADDIREAATQLRAHEWLSVETPPPEKKYTDCLVALWYHETSQWLVRAARYDGYSKSFEPAMLASSDYDYEFRAKYWMEVPDTGNLPAPPGEQ